MSVAKKVHFYSANGAYGYIQSSEHKGMVMNSINIDGIENFKGKTIGSANFFDKAGTEDPAFGENQ